MMLAAGGKGRQLFQGDAEYKVMERIGTRLGMNPDGNPVFEVIVQGQEVSYRTDAVLFSDRVTTVLAQFGERTWRLPVDTWDSTLRIWRPMPDTYTSKRVDLLLSLLSTGLSTRTLMSSEDRVKKQTLSGHIVTSAIPEITVIYNG